MTISQGGRTVRRWAHNPENVGATPTPAHLFIRITMLTFIDFVCKNFS